MMSEDKQVDPYDVMGGDALAVTYTSGYGTAKIHCLTPNAPRDLPRQFHDIEEPQDLLSVDMYEDLRWFRNAYDQEVTLLTAVFPEVSFHWGYVPSDDL